MLQASEQTTPEKATTQSNRRRNWFIYAVLASVLIAGIVGLSWSLSNDARNKQESKSSSSVAQTPGLRGSTNEDGAAPAAADNAAGVVEDPSSDNSTTEGENPVPVDEGATIEQENGDNAPPSNGKTSWPELVGRPGEEARSIIMQENPNMTLVQLVPVGSFVTADWREDRVRIYVEEDETKTVASIPNMG